MSVIITGDSLGKQVHALEDRLIGARMLGWMTDESKKTNWWLCGVTGDGKIVSWDSTALGRYSPEKEKCHYAVRVLSALADVEMDGGTWLVSWIDDCKRFHFVFKDHDGDIQACVDCDKNWLVIREWDMSVWQNMAAHAWAQWREFDQNMDVSASQKFKLAAGEKPPSMH